MSTTRPNQDGTRPPSDREARGTSSDDIDPSDGRSADDRDVGWGDEQAESRDDRWYREQRPPHWE